MPPPPPPFGSTPSTIAGRSTSGGKGRLLWVRPGVFRWSGHRQGNHPKPKHQGPIVHGSRQPRGRTSCMIHPCSTCVDLRSADGRSDTLTPPEGLWNRFIRRNLLKYTFITPVTGGNSNMRNTRPGQPNHQPNTHPPMHPFFFQPKFFCWKIFSSNNNVRQKTNKTNTNHCPGNLAHLYTNSLVGLGPSFYLCSCTCSPPVPISPDTSLQK